MQFYLSYHLYIVACAGAGATVIALVRFHFIFFLSNLFISRIIAENGLKLLSKELLWRVEKTVQYSAVVLFRNILKFCHQFRIFRHRLTCCTCFYGEVWSHPLVCLSSIQLIYVMATTYNFAVLKFKSYDHSHTTKFWAFCTRATAKSVKVALRDREKKR